MHPERRGLATDCRQSRDLVDTEVRWRHSRGRASSWLRGTSTPARACTSDVARHTSRIHCWCTPRTRWRYVASVRCTSCERMSFIACAISDRGCHCAGVQCCESGDRLAAHQSSRICRWHCADDSRRGCRVTLASSGHRNPFGGFDSLDAAPCASRTQGRVEPLNCTPLAVPSSALPDAANKRADRILGVLILFRAHVANP